MFVYIGLQERRLAGEGDLPRLLRLNCALKQSLQLAHMIKFLILRCLDKVAFPRHEAQFCSNFMGHGPSLPSPPVHFGKNDLHYLKMMFHFPPLMKKWY